MIDTAALNRAMIVGTLLQVVLAITAHFWGWVALHALLFGAMMLAAVSGYLYAQDVDRGYLAGAAGGLLAGGVCGIFGASLAIVLGDTDPGLLVQNTLIFVLTGGLGGLFGQMAARMAPAAH
jgi:hypothetical protein